MTLLYIIKYELSNALKASTSKTFIIVIAVYELTFNSLANLIRSKQTQIKIADSINKIYMNYKFYVILFINPFFPLTIYVL